MAGTWKSDDDLPLPRFASPSSSWLSLLVENGHMLEENLRRERISADEMQSALREHGVAMIANVASAVLETDGTISVCQVGHPTVKRLRTVRSSRNR